MSKRYVGRIRSADPTQGPRCRIAGCKNVCGTSMKHPDGKYSFRSVCMYHKLLSEAIRAGFRTVAEYRKTHHRYLKYRKNYCENIDGRLGYVCENKVTAVYQLDVDHINANHADNRPENLQTLCKMCHAYKTINNRDWQKSKQNTVTFKIAEQHYDLYISKEKHKKHEDQIEFNFGSYTHKN